MQMHYFLSKIILHFLKKMSFPFVFIHFLFIYAKFLVCGKEYISKLLYPKIKKNFSFFGSFFRISKCDLLYSIEYWRGK